MLLHLATGLDYLYGHGIQHGDIRPVNIFINNSGDYIVADHLAFYDKTQYDKALFN
jgi:serine/threonine protein kinase